MTTNYAMISPGNNHPWLFLSLYLSAGFLYPPAISRLLNKKLTIIFPFRHKGHLLLCSYFCFFIVLLHLLLILPFDHRSHPLLYSCPRSVIWDTHFCTDTCFRLMWVIHLSIPVSTFVLFPSGHMFHFSFFLSYEPSNFLFPDNHESFMLLSIIWCWLIFSGERKLR